MFRLFRLAVFLTNNLSLSTDTVQHRRFCRERRHIDGFTSENRSGEKVQTIKTGSILNDIRWFLKYNQNGLPYLLLIILHLVAIIYGLTTQTIYAFLPADRDSLTKEYINPILKTLESFHFLNFFENHQYFNKIFALHLLQVLIMRLRFLQLKIRNARINRYNYRKINIFQVDVAYVSELISDLGGWLRLMMTLGKHECRVGTSLQGKRGELMRKLGNQVNSLNKVDRSYFFNQIDFNECYDHLNIQLTTITNQSGGDEWDQVSWFDYLLRVNLPSRQSFVPKPCHRMDPFHLSILAFFYLAGTLLLVVLLSVSYLSYLAIGLEVQLGDWSLAALYGRPWLLVGAIEGWILFLPLAINAYDCGLAAYSSLLIHSRTEKLIKMLTVELQCYRSLVELFWLSFNRESSNKEANLSWLAEHTATLSSRYQDFVTKQSRLSRTGLEHCSPTYLSVNNQSPIVSTRPVSVCNSKLTLLDCATSGFKAKLGFRKFNELNDNINYLLNLIEVLQEELDDSKSNFTLYLNMNVLFATISAALTFTIITSLAQGMAETLLAMAFVFANFVPMLAGLCLGATSERSFRQIYHNLVPFTINELGLVQLPIVRRLQKFCHHLAKIENRSFVVLGSFPLTFGSLTSMLIWTSSGILILQKFLV